MLTGSKCHRAWGRETVPLDPDQMREFAWKVHAYLTDQIKFADAKAGAVFTLGSAIVGGLWASHAHRTLNSAPSSWGWRGTVAAVAFLLLFTGLISAALVVRPRLKSSQSPAG